MCFLNQVKKYIGCIVLIASVTVSTGYLLSGENTYLLSSKDIVLTLTVDSTIAGIKAKGQDVSSDTPRGGFFISDIGNHKYGQKVGGKLKDEGQTLIQTDSLASLGLNFSATYTAYADYIQIKGEIENLSESERAINVKYVLPVDASGWKWWDDLNHFLPIETNAQYATVANADVGGGSLSIYPFSGISGPKTGLSLAVPPFPQTFRIYYDNITKQYTICFYLGLSKLTKKFPNKAFWEFIIYTHDSQWGFRSTAKRYYDFYPDYFTKKPVREGLWFSLGTSGYVVDESLAKDLGLMFNEITLVIERKLQEAVKDESFGIYSLIYTIPTRWNSWTGGKFKKHIPTKEEADKFLKESAATKTVSSYAQDRFIAILNSALQDWEGNIVACWSPAYDLGWYLNCDPEIPGHTVAKMELNTIKEFFTRVKEKGAVADGVYFDGIGVCEGADYCQERFQYVDYPLSYGFRKHVPMIYPPMSAYKFVKYLHSYLPMLPGGKESEKITLDNYTFLQPANFTIFLIDVVGLETQYKGFRWHDIFFLDNKTVAYHKPTSFLCYVRNSKDSKKDVEDVIKTGLFYGIYPGIETSLWAENRDILKEYVPMIREISMAGWEPVTYADTSDESVKVERFGDFSKGLYFTLRNFTPYEKRINLNIETKELAVPLKDLMIFNICTKSSCPYTSLKDGVVSVPVSIKGKDTILLKISGIADSQDFYLF